MIAASGVTSQAGFPDDAEEIKLKGLFLAIGSSATVVLRSNSAFGSNLAF
jgi:hypothetical protein